MDRKKPIIPRVKIKVDRDKFFPFVFLDEGEEEIEIPVEKYREIKKIFKDFRSSQYYLRTLFK